jgi:phage N-6-adenine-methyltransferase
MTTHTALKPARSQARTTSDPSVRAAVFSSASDNWPTPQAFFDTLNAEFGFVLDACGSDSNRKAGAYYGLDHADPDRRDGLTGDWAADGRRLGGPVWLNSPYGRGIGAWMAKAAATAAAGVTVVALVPARTDTAWFHDHVLAHGAEVRHVRGRLKFGDATSSAPFANLVIVFHAAPAAPAAAASVAPLTGSADRVPSRPQRHVEGLLEPRDGHQVRPAVARQQRLQRGTGQAGVPADRRQAPAGERDPQVHHQLLDVPGRHRRLRRELTVREAVGELLGWAAQARAAANHVPDATAAACTGRGARRGELQPTPCELSDQRGTLRPSRTPVRTTGDLFLPRQSARKGGTAA